MLFPAVKLLIISHAFAAEALKTEESSNVPKKQQNSAWLTGNNPLLFNASLVYSIIESSALDRSNMNMLTSVNSNE